MDLVTLREEYDLARLYTRSLYEDLPEPERAVAAEAEEQRHCLAPRAPGGGESFSAAQPVRRRAQHQS